MSTVVLHEPETPRVVAAASAGARNRSRVELFVAAVLFGLVAVLTRRAALGGFSAGQLATLRFAVGALASVAYFAARPGSFVGARRMPLVVRGLAGGVAVVLYFVSLALIPAGEATLLNNLYPVLTTVLAIFTLGERPTIHLVGALVLTTIGVVLVLGGDELHLGFAGASSRACCRASSAPSRSQPSAPRGCRWRSSRRQHGHGLLRAHDGRADRRVAVRAASVADRGCAVGARARRRLRVPRCATLDDHALGFLAIPEASIWQQLAPVMSFLWGAALLTEPVSAATMAGVATAGLGVVYGAVLGRRSKHSL